MEPRTLGIDLAADSRRTGSAVVDWSGRRPVVVDIRTSATDQQLATTAPDIGRIGIDCPLGWPTAFLDFVTRHAAGQPVPAAETVAQRRPLAYRRTDTWVTEHARPLRPLSVSADRIAHPAFRAAALLRHLDPTLDRSGLGRVVEAYPSGSLHHWGLPFRGYKGPDGVSRRAEIIAALSEVVEFPHDARRQCHDSDHALDAVVAALTARAAQLGRVTLPDADDLPVARVEGWILLPTCSLAELA